MDYHDPSAGSGRLSLIKVNATGERKGTLFVNPGTRRLCLSIILGRVLDSHDSDGVGGPGETGVGYIALDGPQILNTTGGNYDIVSWDPRGVGVDTM